MSQHNRVVWAEGLFLRPQHFQQAERYFERLMSQRLESLVPYGAGFTKLQIDQELLKVGKVGDHFDRVPGVIPFARGEPGIVQTRQ